TRNRKEHQAVAMAVLDKLIKETGVDLSKVDAKGGNIWVWAKNTHETGLRCLKAATAKCEVPADWKEKYLDVVSTYSSRPGKRDPDPGIFNPGAKHKELAKWLEENRWPAEWDANLKLLRTHTGGLEAAHKALKLRGEFSTDSPKTDSNKANCFCWPTENDGE